jgi:dolichol-phosphate mannosyltransferase
VSAALGAILAMVQAVLGLRVVWRLLRTGRDGAITAAPSGAIERGSVAVVVPVLDEARRIGPCLEGVIQLGSEVGQILVIDGASNDGTPDLVRAFARRDPRVRLIEAGAAPTDWNGKVWGLDAGARELHPSVRWLLTIDADVRVAPALARSLVVWAEQRELRMLSVATAQRVSGFLESLLHPALLTTLVYRFGRPGTATRTPSAAMANGQCMLIRRDLLDHLGGFRRARGSLCEDVTLARLAARAGDAVGFYQADGLVEVAMFSDWRDAWANWPRSLTTRDALFGVAGWLGLLEVLLVQALPLPLVLGGAFGGLARRINLVLLSVRLGMLLGVAPAYPTRPLSYWLSALLDLPVALALWRSALRREHVWRGRPITRQKGTLVA